MDTYGCDGWKNEWMDGRKTGWKEGVECVIVLFLMVLSSYQQCTADVLMLQQSSPGGSDSGTAISSVLVGI